MSTASFDWDAVSAFGGVLAALASLGSVYYAFKTVRMSKSAAEAQGQLTERLALLSVESARATSREKTANETYDNYLRLCIEHSALASWDIAVETYRFKSAEDIWHFGNADSEKYLWFLSYALNAFERILVDAEGSSDADWMAAIEDQIAYHKPALRVLWQTNFRNHYGNEIDAAVQRVLADNTREPAR